MSKLSFTSTDPSELALRLALAFYVFQYHVMPVSVDDEDQKQVNADVEAIKKVFDSELGKYRPTVAWIAAHAALIDKVFTTLPESIFRDLFPEGVTNHIVSKYQSYNINHLEKALESGDAQILRETLIGVLWHYASVEARNNRLSDTAIEQAVETIRMQEDLNLITELVLSVWNPTTTYVDPVQGVRCIVEALKLAQAELRDEQS